MEEVPASSIEKYKNSWALRSQYQMLCLILSRFDDKCVFFSFPLQGFSLTSGKELHTLPTVGCKGQ